MLHPRLAAGGDADVGRGAADVERDHVLKATAASGVDASQLAGRRPRQHQVDRGLVALVERRHPARALHQVRRTAHPLLLQRLVQPVEVATHAWSDVGVDRRRREALVLAVLRAYLAGDRHERPGHSRSVSSRNRCSWASLTKRAEQADRHRLDALTGQVAQLALGRLLVQRSQHAAIGEHPLGHAAAVLAQHQRPRLLRDVLHDAEVQRLAVPGDVQHVPEAVGGDHPDASAAALEDRVGPDRRPVQQLRQPDGWVPACWQISRTP